MPDKIEQSNIDFGLYLISQGFNNNGKTLTGFSLMEAKYN